MKIVDQVKDQTHEGVAHDGVADTNPLAPLVVGRSTMNAASSSHSAGVVVGDLVAMDVDGLTPLVMFPGQSGSSAIAARSTVSLRGRDVGQHVVLVFEDGDWAKPIVLGVIRVVEAWPFDDRPGQVEVDVDGERLTVSAKEELVLRCGKASITLTRAGKILLEGRYVSSRSSGVNRIKGGSVHIN